MLYNGSIMPEKNSFLELNNVTVLRDNKKILNNISLKIDQHEHVVILGPNGSGKSTLLKIIAGDLRPLHHARSPVRLFGSETWTLLGLRQKIGFVSNELQSIYQREITGRDVILSGFFGSIGLFDTCTKEQIQKAKQIGKMLGIIHLFERSIESMSSGEARRFLIARALVHDPKILVFDEPTNSLDIKAHSLVLETIRKLASNGYTIVLVTHNIAEIIPEIERVIMLKAGRVIKDGPKAKILTANNISRLFARRLGFVRKKGFYFLA